MVGIWVLLSAVVPICSVCSAAVASRAASVRGGTGLSDSGGSDRRWDALMSSCQGSWSGTIGWLDIEGDEVVPREENHKQNMRLSFFPRESNGEIADWVVYHARAVGVRQEAILYKHTAEDPMANVGPKQTFYCFPSGNLGRSGYNFAHLPVIEHGFWDATEGMRRSIVLAYDPRSGNISKLCYLQQKRQHNDATFDVTHTDISHCSIMPHKSLTLPQLRSTWQQSNHSVREEVLDTLNGQYTTPQRDTALNSKQAISKLLGTTQSQQSEDNMFRMVLPNGIVLACPSSFKAGKPFDVYMGYKRECGEIQITEFNYDDHSIIKKVTARWIQTK